MREANRHHRVFTIYYWFPGARLIKWTKLCLPLNLAPGDIWFAVLITSQRCGEGSKQLAS